MENRYADRIKALRRLMGARGWDAVVIFGSDPHCSEYPSERWKQVLYLSGFTGEAGDIVVTPDHAGLWTDTRYFIQADRQLAGTGVQLHKTRVPGQVLIPEWLSRHFADAPEAVVAVDGLCTGTEQFRELQAALPQADIVPVADILGSLWPDRPEIPQTPVFLAETGESTGEKLSWLRSFCESRSCDGIFIPALDEIAWLLNVRASDIEYNPFVISYLLVTVSDGVSWFVVKDPDADPQTEESFGALRAEGVEVLPYDDAESALAAFEGRLYIDPSSLNFQFRRSLECSDVELVEGPSPVGARKAVKNPFEIAGMRQACVRDGVAMENFLYWLEKSVDDEREVSEWDASVYLGRQRGAIAGYVSDSFETIAAYGPGAALPHYVTPRENSPRLRDKGLFLCDSGGQYTFGTTDITRTVPLGECTDLEREDYTLVLKGHIALARAVFPEGTAGCQIDSLAREPLWRAGRNFGHGTGHGVGFFLGVHEGPQDIRQNFNPTPLVPGMIVSDEPGIYREGMHGVRHENLLLCTSAGSSEFGNWLGFETLTLCHFDTSALVRELLSPEETAWLNEYNERVFSVLSPYLSENVALWLRRKTAAI